MLSRSARTPSTTPGHLAVRSATVVGKDPRHLAGRSKLSAVTLAVASLISSAFLLVQHATPHAEAAMTYQAQVLNQAAHHKGQPYRYGADGPTRFDCSGFTKYVFGRMGKNLPHNAAAQYSVVHHVAKSALQPGDLIFFKTGSGHITHVGIYAGHGKMWHAPHSGTVIKLAAVYSSNYVVGRI